jgi:alkylation response protein AidB-like acyl-CoA dehydrogenase
VQGGALLNGRKVFISTGHLAKEHVVLMPFDLRDPLNTFACFLVPGDAPGFSLGRKERKMGQWAGPASELVFEDCFVPEENIVLAADTYPEPGLRGKYPMLLETVLGITRTMVGAMSTGAARGVFERTLDLARKTPHRGKPLIRHQWVQAQLTDMFMNVVKARAVYLEATFALMNNLNPIVSGVLPRFVNSEAAGKVLDNRWSRGVLHSEWYRKILFRRLLSASPEANARIQAASSMAKVVGSDAAMENAHRAVSLLSRAGLRHDQGVEKFFRDAKLLQIFEGTNQLNRLNVFKYALARHIPGVEVF